MLAGLLRHLLTTLGGSLLTAGYLSSSELDAAIGALITLAGIVWSVVQKTRQAPS